jgi:hypothetical protein
LGVDLGGVGHALSDEFAGAVGDLWVVCEHGF